MAMPMFRAALIDFLVKAGVKPTHAKAIHHAIDRLQLQDGHPDDIAAILFTWNAEQCWESYQQGLEEKQMILVIPNKEENRSSAQVN